MNTSKNGSVPKVEIRSGRGTVYMATGIALVGAAVFIGATLLAAERPSKPAASTVAVPSTPQTTSPIDGGDSRIAGGIGACCDAGSGQCADGVSAATCAVQGNNFQGSGSQCAVCNGGPNAGMSCRRCVGGSNPGVSCNSNSDCLGGGTCAQNTAQCRTCVGGSNPGTPCTGNAQCTGGGTCPPLGNTCSTGLVGNSCLVNADCNLAGTCDLANQACSTGNIGQPCTSDAQCNVAGTCVPVTCQAIASCNMGACCDPGMGTCTETAGPPPCAANGANFQGYGTECDVDGGFDPAQQHCCPISNYMGLRCMSGPNNLQTCTVDGDCRFCVEGPNDGAACSIHTDCARCVGGTNNNQVCAVDADCPDNFAGSCVGHCLGRCVTRGTGGDSCEDAFIHVITVPDLSDGPKTITISGNNNPATSTAEEPDNCSIGGDPMWWEAFAVDKCAYVRIDLCCSDPQHSPAYELLFDDCACGNPIDAEPDPDVFGQPASAFGSPYCPDGNLWATFPFLEAGAYYYPINSVSAGVHGPYQMHITVKACAQGANDVPAGSDMFVTPPGCVTFVDLGDPDATPIPGDFFGPGSDPFLGVICLQGAPLACTVGDYRCKGADTIVERLSDASLPLVGSSATVDIQIRALHLVSENPITVTFNSGATSSQYDVEVFLSEHCEQRIGSMTINRDVPDGGTFTSQLSVTVKLVFTKVGPGPGAQTATLDPPGECVGGPNPGASCSTDSDCAPGGICACFRTTDELFTGPTPQNPFANPGHWFQTVPPAPPTYFSVPAGDADHDGDGVMVEAGSSFAATTSNFYAGLSCSDPMSLECYKVSTPEEADWAEHGILPLNDNNAPPSGKKCIYHITCREGSNCSACPVVPGTLCQHVDCEDVVDCPQLPPTTCEGPNCCVAFKGVDCRVPETEPVCPNGNPCTCAPECPSSHPEDDVRRYACDCYDALGITADQLMSAGWWEGIKCRTDAKQLHTTVNDVIQDINLDGTATPVVPNPNNAGGFPPECDRPAWLPDGDKHCYGNTYIRRWDIDATDGGKVTVALLCRHKKIWSDGDTDFDDIAMIMHNNKSGKTCWFQQPYSSDGPPSVQNQNDGMSVPAPHADDAPRNLPINTRGWLKPSQTAFVNCISCHDNGPWMNSRWMFNSGIDLKDGFEPYINVGPAFQEGYFTDTAANRKKWKAPNFITVDAAGIKPPPAPTPQVPAPKDYRKKSCTSCHGIDSGEAGGNGQSIKDWIKYTVGSTVQDNKYPPHSREHKCAGGTRAGMACIPSNDCPNGACNATGVCVGGSRNGQGCDCPSGTCPPDMDIDFWMPHAVGSASDVYAADADHWGTLYKKHVHALLLCAETKGEKSIRKCLGGTQANMPCTKPEDCPGGECPAASLCEKRKETTIPRSVASVAAALTPGVHLYADTNNDGNWDHDIAASPDSGAPPNIVPVSAGTPLAVGWSADAEHLNCFIGTTFPAGVAVNGTSTATNWLLSDSPQTIGVLSVPGGYYFHIDCSDDDYGQIYASLTFQVAGQSPTVLYVQGIVDGVGTVTFDYPTPGQPHADIPVAPSSDVKIGWIAFNVVPQTCTLSETFDPSGPTSRTFMEESGFESVTLYPMTRQNYTLACTGDDGQAHSVDVTLRVVVAPTPVWNPSSLSPDRTTRSLRFTVQPPVTATGTAGQSAIKMTMIDLQNPNPPNLPANPPPDFSAFESATCTAVGETNGCARWVGKPGTFLESQDIPGLGNYRAARLQCTPFYHDWTKEGPIAVVGAEIAPSSEYSIQAYSESCRGAETGCTNVSAPVQMFTRRSGDVELPLNPPSTSAQPDVTDVAQLVNKFKNLPGALPKATAQLQPNLPELNADINALDIVAVVDAVKQRAYAFGGPCPCPSTVTCLSTGCASPTPCVTAFGSGAMCVKTCTGPGPLAGDPCINNTHCVGSGTCGPGFCRDRCGRCSP